MRTAVVAVLVALGLAGLASAATITGTERRDVLRGTPRGDLIVARGGRDVVHAGAGDDRVAVQYDGSRDTVRCGPGRDVVTADRSDAVASDCEIVTRLISRDPFATADGQHETQVEPSAVAAGGTIVTAFQSGRRHTGGAANIGFSSSLDGGRSWRGGHLPALTVNSRPAGGASFASDPVVAYDATHRTWLISTLALAANATELTISRSTDGLRWGAPVVAARFAGGRLGFDKNWAACDNWPQSPHLGRCYLAYTDLTTGAPRLAVQVSDDGGATWSEQVVGGHTGEVVGVLPVPRPDGSLVVPYLAEGELQSVRSSDGGASLEEPVTIARVRHRGDPVLREAPLPAVDVDAGGRVYVVWQDCRFRPACNANDVVLSISGDGRSWSEPVRATRGGGSAFLAALAVDRATGRLALAYHRCTGVPCRTDVLLARSRDGGASWSAPRLLNAQPMRVGWIPTTTGGRMLGDYVAVTWSGDRPVAVFALASPPWGGKLRQAIAAARVP